MAKRLSENEKNEITTSFTNGIKIEELSKKFKCSKSTIIRNLKKSLGDDQYAKLIIKYKSYQGDIDTQSYETNNTIFNEFDDDSSLKIIENQEPFQKESVEEEMPPLDSFFELTPISHEIDFELQKDLASVHISEINFPKIVYLIVDKNIELETKFLKDYSIWQFLPEKDLNRKTIEIFHDLNKAKRVCNKGQKVIKVPNTGVFRIVAPILISKGISRIISSDQLIVI